MIDTTTSARSTTHSGGGIYRPLRWLIPLALLHGLLYLAIVPPWQHYDEPSHFEYAWLIANHDPRFVSTEVDNEFRREVADSMYRFRFYEPGQRSDLLAANAPTLGANQRIHPILYYAMASIPLHLVSGIGIEQQLYLIRSLSLCFYVLTIVIAWRVATVVTPDNPLMQLTIPLLLLLTPTFIDIMTAVNNDVLVNFCAAAMLLGCVLLIRNGPQFIPWALMTLALGVGLGAKRTIVILIIPYLITLIWSWHRAPLRFWIIIVTLLVIIVTLSKMGLEVTHTINGVQVLILRPWLDQIDTSYLRLDLDHWIRSVSNTAQSSYPYQQLMIIGFTSFWTRFSWDQVEIGPWADWTMAGICVVCGVGIFIQDWRTRGTLLVWQHRCIWLFLIMIILGVLSLIARLHPLPSPGMKLYIPTGRYIFTIMLPVIWLVALGWQGLLPARWQPYGLFALLGVWLTFDLIVWCGTLTGFFYSGVR